jgi:uncharacterized protein (TIGR01777 family)
MTDFLWILLFIQVAMGGSDTLFHHELTQQLAWRPSQAVELKLHGVRNLAYAVMFIALGWSRPLGAAALGLIALMVGELVITLWDFVEEDRTRALPASERVLHTLLTLNYGVVLAALVPLLLKWAAEPTGVEPAFYGAWSSLCAVAAVGVILSGLRDLAAAARTRRLAETDPAKLATALAGRRSILVTGGTGFVGRRLVAALVAGGHEVTVLTRRPAAAAALPAPLRIVTSLDQIPAAARIDAVVNLAGEPISDAPWTRAKRLRILRSRLTVTREVVRLVARLKEPPEVLVSGSAIGWYGLRGDEALDEGSDGTPCFSRDLCLRWEKAAAPVQDNGVRLVLLRTGLVLATEGGMLSRLLTPFELGLGGPFACGSHWMSWIHRDDLVRLIVHAIATPTLEGPLNGTAPEPVRNRDFAKALGRALHRPALLAVPPQPLRLVLGDFAEELLLRGQKVLPAEAVASGFRFTYPTLDRALETIVGAAPSRRLARNGPAEGALNNSMFNSPERSP